MSGRPWHNYGSSWHGRGFVKRGYFHSRGPWRSRPYFRRTFRKRTEEEEEEVQPEIRDEVGADDDEEETPPTQQEDVRESEKDVRSKEKSTDQIKDQENDKDDGDSDVVEITKEEEHNSGKYEIDKLMLSEDWEVMDETDDEDEEEKKKKLTKDMLSIEISVPEIADKLKEVKEPLIGLEYLVEIRNEEGTTYYSCVLCKRPGRVAALFRHLNYIEHKIKYLERHFQEVANAFPRGHPTTFKHEYLVAVEKLCELLAKTNARPETFLITTKNFYTRKLMALLFRAEQLPHMTFEDDSWKKIFEELNLPLKRSERRGRDRRSRSHDRENRSRSRDRDRSPYRKYHRENYRGRDDYYQHYGNRGRYQHKWVPYHQYKYQNYYRGWVPRGYMSQTPYYYYDNRSNWNNYRHEGYYDRNDNSSYRGHEKSFGRSYRESESRSSHHDEVKEAESYHSGTRESGGIYATTIKKKSSSHERPVARKEEKKATSAADVKKLWDQLTKPKDSKKGEKSANSFWDQWIDGHNDDDDDEVTIIDQTTGASKTMNSDLNSVAEMLDKNLTKIMDNYDHRSGSTYPVYSQSTSAANDKIALVTKIARALTTMGMSNIPQETLVLILQQLGLLPGGHDVGVHSSRAMDNLRRTIVKFDSVSQNFSR